MRDLSGQNLVWVWNLERCDGGDAVRMADRLTRHGATGCIIKHDDGGHPFGQCWDPARTSALIRGLQQAGLVVGLWGYHYAPAINGIRMVKRAISFLPDFYVIDWEVEFEQACVGKNRLRTWLYGCGHDRGDVGLFHAPLAQPGYHKPWQYEQFDGSPHIDGVLPQVYHKAMGFRPEDSLLISYNDFVALGLTRKPLYPAGQAYDVPPEEMLRWSRAATQTMGAQGLSWWSYEHMTAEMWSAIQLDLEEDNMRRVNGIAQGWAAFARRRTILKPGTYGCAVRTDFGLTERDRKVVLDLEFAPAWGIGELDLVGNRHVVIHDGDGSFAGLLGGSAPWRVRIPVYMSAGTWGTVTFEVCGGEVRPVLVGILEAGG